jgi:aminoglycoside 6'-N-acetyltransferase I
MAAQTARKGRFLSRVRSYARMPEFRMPTKSKGRVIDADWIAMLWPECTAADSRRDIERMRSNPRRFGAFLAQDEAGRALGFVEVSARHDYVNGTEHSPVGFIEGIYVVPRARKRGVARALLRAAQRWSAAAGCREMASDALLRNRLGHAFHRAAGFTESDRVVYFVKRIGKSR